MADLESALGAPRSNSSAIILEFPRGGHHDRSDLERKPKPIIRASRDGEDPIFALIEHHRALAARYTAAVEVSGAMSSGDPRETAAEEITDEACTDLLDFCDGHLFRRPQPSTLAGMIAFLEYLGRLEEWESPRSNALCDDKKRKGCRGWLFEMCQALARAAKQIDGRTGEMCS